MARVHWDTSITYEISSDPDPDVDDAWVSVSIMRPIAEARYGQAVLRYRNVWCYGDRPTWF